MIHRLHRLLFRRLPLVTLVLMAGFFCLGRSSYAAQQAESASSGTSAGASSEATPSEAKPADAAAAEGKAESLPETVEREKERKEQEELEALRKSPSVMKISSMTGMSPNSAYWASVILNFVLIAVLLVYLIGGKAPAFFRDRTVGIQKGMAEATRVSQDATQRLQQIEGRLGKLDHEIEAMRATAENEARAEEERLKVATEEEQHKLLEAAQQEITAATSQARRELKGFAAELAIGLAEKQIRVDAAADQNLVQQFASHLGHDQAGVEPKGSDKQ